MAKEVVLAFFLLTDYSGNQWLLIILANCAYIYFKTDGGTNILWSINTKTVFKNVLLKIVLEFQPLLTTAYTCKVHESVLFFSLKTNMQKKIILRKPCFAPID